MANDYCPRSKRPRCGITCKTYMGQGRIDTKARQREEKKSRKIQRTEDQRCYLIFKRMVSSKELPHLPGPPSSSLIIPCACIGVCLCFFLKGSISAFHDLSIFEEEGQNAASVYVLLNQGVFVPVSCAFAKLVGVDCVQVQSRGVAQCVHTTLCT